MVVLATKCYVSGDARERSLDSMEALLDDAVGGLEVSWTVGVRDDDWVSVTLSGPDEVAARNALREQWGEVPTHLEAGETYVGTLESWDEDVLEVDLGPETAAVAAGDLGLGPGTATQVRDRFGLVQHQRLRVVYDDPPRLAEAEVDRLYDWTRGEGRLNANSATRGEVRATVNRAGHARDVVTVERLGLLEQSVVCTASTDPPGLLSAVGEYLPAELRCVVP
ncbi:MAG: uncharacterized protein conserved in archaea [uncultured archaeon A07HB70]|jgi:Uncharacterized protein conserved in archaea|nr:MAG: uncharacterized protein conserved in archaea [uncultured archaeon A07HB70]